MISFKEYNLLIESFTDAKNKWFGRWGEDHDEGVFFAKAVKERIDKSINLFKELKMKNQLSGKEKDISYWIPKSFEEFESFVDLVQEKYENSRPLKKKMLMKDAPIVFENDKATVYHILSKAASCNLGSGTDWCISKEGQNYYDDYTESNITFYFIIDKNPVYGNKDLSKVAVSVDNANDWEIYDRWDDIIPANDFENFLDKMEIPRNILKHVPIIIEYDEYY